MDGYLRVNNQYAIYIKNNNQVKCTYSGCRHDEEHKMTQMYQQCSCKNDECNLKYSISSCPHGLAKWKLSKAGDHIPIVDLITGLPEVISKINISSLVIKLIKKTVDNNPDLKAKGVLIQITKKKNTNVLLTRDIAYRKTMDPKYIPPVLPDPDYHFSEDLMPTLTQVYINTFFILFVN